MQAGNTKLTREKRSICLGRLRAGAGPAESKTGELNCRSAPQGISASVTDLSRRSTRGVLKRDRARHPEMIEHAIAGPG